MSRASTIAGRIPPASCAFEQCNDNLIAENSATHGGDCFFGFAGHDAIGEKWMNRERARLRKETGRKDVDDLIKVPDELAKSMSALGCNRNLLIENDFSYAPAHGIEMTFSEGNQFIRNRLVENAICGVWGGYSSDTLIAENEFTGNGGMAYGLERGGINMEHAADNLIVKNRFLNNKCAVHLWWNDGGALLKYPGVLGTEKGVIGNIIAGNRFEINRDVPFKNLRSDAQLLCCSSSAIPARGRWRAITTFGNEVKLTHPQAVEFAVKPGSEPLRAGEMPRVEIPEIPRPRPDSSGRRAQASSRTRPDHHGRMGTVGSRKSAGPPGEIRPGRTRVRSLRSSSSNEGEGARGRRLHRSRDEYQFAGARCQEAPLRARSGVASYRVRVAADGFEKELSGTIIAAEWRVRVFPWKVDPREDLAAWRKLADGPERSSGGRFQDRLSVRHGWPA